MCTGVSLHIIEPAGFRLDDRNLKRSGMDYLELATLTRHISWNSFCKWQMETSRRVVLLTTRAYENYTGFDFRDDDLLLLGRESSGVPQNVHNYAAHRIGIRMAENARSLNIAIAGAMVLGEALRQTRN